MTEQLEARRLLGSGIAVKIQDWRLAGLLFSSISPAIQRLILKPLAVHFLDFKLSCSDLAESGSTFNGLVDVVIVGLQGSLDEGMCLTHHPDI